MEEKTSEILIVYSKEGPRIQAVSCPPLFFSKKSFASLHPKRRSRDHTKALAYPKPSQR